MANEKHLEILSQGVDVWNLWRANNPAIMPDLTGTNLRNWYLRAVNLSGASLRGSDMRGADLGRANLVGAELSGADLTLAHFVLARLVGTNLRQADLGGANLRGANLHEADLTNARIGWTILADVDLSQAKGLETIRHDGPSTIGIDTIYRSKAKIPEAFLRGAGIPDTFITYIRSIVGQPIEFYSCFISYSSKDDEFAQRLYADLQNKQVRCWYAPEDLKIGDRFRDRIEEAIRIHDKLLLVLSANSIDSPWVRSEVEAAFEREARQQRSILFPISIDNTFETTTQAWATDLRRTRHIGDFSRWKDHDCYKTALDRLLRDLAAKSQLTNP